MANQAFSDVRTKQPSKMESAVQLHQTTSSGSRLLHNGFAKVPHSTTGLTGTLPALFPGKNRSDQLSDGSLADSLIKNPLPDEDHGVQPSKETLHRTYSEPIPAVAIAATPRPPGAAREVSFPAGLPKRPNTKSFGRLPEELMREMGCRRSNILCVDSAIGGQFQSSIKNSLPISTQASPKPLYSLCSEPTPAVAKSATLTPPAAAKDVSFPAGHESVDAMRFGILPEGRLGSTVKEQQSRAPSVDLGTSGQIEAAPNNSVPEEVTSLPIPAASQAVAAKVSVTGGVIRKQESPVTKGFRKITDGLRSWWRNSLLAGEASAMATPNNPGLPSSFPPPRRPPIPDPPPFWRSIFKLPLIRTKLPDVSLTTSSPAPLSAPLAPRPSGDQLRRIVVLTCLDDCQRLRFQYQHQNFRPSLLIIQAADPDVVQSMYDEVRELEIDTRFGPV